MERLVKVAGGNSLNSFDDIQDSDLGWAENVYEQVLGENKYFFVDGVKNPSSCTILIKGPNQHSIVQVHLLHGKNISYFRKGLYAHRNFLSFF